MKVNIFCNGHFAHRVHAPTLTKAIKDFKVHARNTGTIIAVEVTRKEPTVLIDNTDTQLRNLDYSAPRQLANADTPKPPRKRDEAPKLRSLAKTRLARWQDEYKEKTK